MSIVMWWLRKTKLGCCDSSTLPELLLELWIIGTYAKHVIGCNVERNDNTLALDGVLS
jgi:hypothetical protein